MLSHPVATGPPPAHSARHPHCSTPGAHPSGLSHDCSPLTSAHTHTPRGGTQEPQPQTVNAQPSRDIDGSAMAS